MICNIMCRKYALCLTIGTKIKKQVVRACDHLYNLKVIKLVTQVGHRKARYMQNHMINLHIKLYMKIKFITES